MLECEVTSTKITSGHKTNILNAGKLVHAIAINNMSVGDKFRSSRSTFANGLMALMEDTLSILVS